MADSKRAKWSNWFEYIFSCIGCIVGLGNVWRFPYLCYQNGGGAFLIPYVIFVFIGALPIACMECSASQFANFGASKVWDMCPLFRGVGYAQVLVCLVASTYYNVIIAWGIFYLVSSFRSELPWTSCDNEWSTAKCYTRFGTNSTNGTLMGPVLNATMLKLTRKTPSEEFWDFKVLEKTDGIEDIGNIRWELLLCLFVAWGLVYVFLIRGIKSSGKVMYVAATLPYLLLTVLLIRGLFLPGAMNGIYYFFVPKWHKLLDVSVWVEAAVQGFYSCGIGWGGYATLASYNRFNNNTQRDALTIMVMDTFTSIFAGMVIFATLGFMADQSGLLIDDVVSHGPGLAFMAYPEALAQLPFPQLWSAIFFLLLFTVGIDSQIVNTQILTTTVMDEFPHLRNRNILVNSVVIIPMFLFGAIYVTQGGMYVLQLIDWYLTTTILLVAALQTFGMAWVYGAERLYADMEMMFGTSPWKVWWVLWKFVTPVVTCALWIASLAQMENVSYGKNPYPIWSIAVGWIVALIPAVPLIGNAVYHLGCDSQNLKQRFKKSCQPIESWLPTREDMRDVYRQSYPVAGHNATEMNKMLHENGHYKV